MIHAAIVVLAKAPQPGLVKTRLTPPYSPHQAANLAAAALTDTLDAAADVAVSRRVLALDGDSTPWQRPGFLVMPQRGDGLDERITAAFDDVWLRTRLPTLLVGMDTPQVSASELSEAVKLLMTGRHGDRLAVLGMAHDGGFWSLGLSSPLPNGLLGVPMSTARTGAATERVLRAAGYHVVMLARHRDVDDAASAAAVAEKAPATAFARLYGTLVPHERTA